MQINLHIEGLDKFDRIKEAAGEKALRSALVAAGRVIRDQAQANIDVDPKNRTGKLKRNVILVHQTEESSGDVRQSYKVTVRSGRHVATGDAYYWRWVEKGHGFVLPFKQRFKGQSTRQWREINRGEYGTSTVPPHPYMRPAYEARREDAIQAAKRRYIEVLKEAKA